LHRDILAIHIAHSKARCERNVSSEDISRIGQNSGDEYA
jgi:hypothetical protein